MENYFTRCLVKKSSYLGEVDFSVSNYTGRAFMHSVHPSEALQHTWVEGFIECYPTTPEQVMLPDYGYVDVPLFFSVPQFA